MSFFNKLSLFQKTLLSLIPIALLITFCYFWADPAFAFWIDHKNLRQFPVFDYFTHIVDAIVIGSVFYYFYFAWAFSYQKKRAQQGQLNFSFSYPLLNVANSVCISLFIKDSLKTVFGRYWPNTWVNNNPSLIHDHAYGFHWFHKGVIYQSFPSGHTTAAVAMAVALWLNFPRGAWRYLGVLLAAAVVIGLLADNYHFLGDCVAGGWIGTIVAIYATTYSNQVRLRLF